MNKTEAEKLKEEFSEFCDNDNTGLEILSLYGAKVISDFWLNKMSEKKAKMVEELSYLTRYQRSKFSQDCSHSENDEEKNTPMLVEKDVLEIINKQ